MVVVVVDGGGVVVVVVVGGSVVVVGEEDVEVVVVDANEPLRSAIKTAKLFGKVPSVRRRPDPGRRS